MSMEMQANLNPIRKVVHMLQSMQKRVEEEGELAEELFHKYMCYCKTADSDLLASIQAKQAKVAELGPAVEAAKSKMDQLKKDIAVHRGDRGATETAMDEATAIRQKEHKAYIKESAEGRTDLNALRSATTALEGGMASSSFVQTAAAATVRDILLKAENPSSDQQEVLSFLSGEDSGEYAPMSGEIVGILKQMGIDMDANQKDMLDKENDALSAYDELMVAKRKEFNALSKSIEEKQGRLGRLGIEIAEMKSEAGDAEETIPEDKAFLKDMKTNCREKAKVHDLEKLSRREEVVALTQTIKILNDDDALEIFKKSLPSAASSFLQLQTTSSAMRVRARAVLNEARSQIKPAQRATRIDFVELALSGRKVGFQKIIRLVDDLVVEIQREDRADDDKKSYCTRQFDITEDKKKVWQRKVADLETSIEETREAILKVTDEIESLKDGIIALDKSVAEATVQRKKENAEYKELMAANAAAKELILFAKKKLSKFYSRQALVQTSSDAADSFVQLASRHGAPPPPPETMDAYTKKSGDSKSVTGMMEILIKDLDREMKAAKSEEELGQEEYERTMKDSGEKRAMDSQTLSDREASKADMKSAVEESRGEEKSSEKKLMSTNRYLVSLHRECDFLLQYYDVRKQSRADEIDALQKSKDVLSGADVSLLQRSRTVRVGKFLHHA